MGMRIAVIGLGGIARRAYLPVLGTRPGLDLVLVGRRAAQVQELQAQYRIERATIDLDEALRQDLKAAFVLTPSDTHAPIVRRLLAAGVDVFVEKPATLHSEETRELAALADRSGRVLMVGYNRRFAPLHRKARALVGERRVDLAIFRKNRAQPGNPDLWSQMIDDTIHQVDLLRYFCGEGKALHTSSRVRDGRLVSAVATVGLENGGIAVIETGLHAGAWSETYEIAGDGQALHVDAFSRLRQVEESGEQVWREEYASRWTTTLDGRGFTGEIDHFLDCVATRRQPETSAWDSVKTQLLLEAIVKSSV